MKKLILILSLMCASVAHAQHWHHGYHGGHGGGYGGGWNWVLPAVIGGAVVYGVTRPPERPVVIEQQTIVAPYAPPAGFHWEQIVDASCNCKRLVLIQNQ